MAEKARQMISLGAAPQAVDIVNFLDGLTFDEAWKNRRTAELASLSVSVLGIQDFIKTKQASGRPKDLADLALLEEASGEGN